MPHIKQRGTALILALLIVGLVAALAFNMMERLSRDLRRTELYLNNLDAELIAEGSILWAADTLCQNWLLQGKGQPQDQLPLSLEPTLYQQFRISTRILDAQASFNLNNLAHKDWLPYFVKLALALEPELSPSEAESLAKAIKSRVSDHYFIDASQLRLVPGMNATLYQKLLPLVTALPTITPININVRTPLIEKLSLVEQSQKHNTTDQNLTLSSDFFLIETEVEKAGQILQIHTLVQRIIQNSQPQIIIISQSRGH